MNTTDTTRRCTHHPPCPGAGDADRLAAAIVAAHPEQGWNLLCNDVITFEDTGAIALAGQVVPPRRASAGTSPLNCGHGRAALPEQSQSSYGRRR
jgi:hypothetical protein